MGKVYKESIRIRTWANQMSKFDDKANESLEPFLNHKDLRSYEDEGE